MSCLFWLSGMTLLPLYDRAPQILAGSKAPAFSCATVERLLRCSAAIQWRSESYGQILFASLARFRACSSATAASMGGFRWDWAAAGLSSYSVGFEVLCFCRVRNARCGISPSPSQSVTSPLQRCFRSWGAEVLRKKIDWSMGVGQRMWNCWRSQLPS